MRAHVVGNGVMGQNHARTLRALGLEVETIDPSPDTDADHQEQKDALLADVAVIATPPAQLATEAAKALHLGVPTVLVEKPMASDIEQAHLLLKAEQENPGKVFVGYTERWNPAVDVLRTQLPMIGDIRHVTISRLGLEPRCPDTGPALDLLTHDVDLLRYLELWPRLLHSVNDGGHITASFSLASGSATLQASHLHPVKRRTMTVLGECGMLTVDLQAQSVTYADQHGVLVLDVPHREPLERQHLALLQGQGVTTSEALINLKVALRAQLPERLTL